MSKRIEKAKENAGNIKKSLMEPLLPGFRKPRTYPIYDLEVGGSIQMAASTAADRKRIARNVSTVGIRYDRGYRCKTDRKTGIMTITRLR